MRSTFDASRVGKRLSKDDPLGPHDVAARLERAVIRTWRILLLVDDAGPDFATEVRGSRYLTNAIFELRKAIDTFLPDGVVQRLDDEISYSQVADELNDGEPGDATLADLDADVVAGAERYARREGLTWPPTVGDFDRYAETHR